MRLGPLRKCVIGKYTLAPRYTADQFVKALGPLLAFALAMLVFRWRHMWDGDRSARTHVNHNCQPQLIGNSTSTFTRAVLACAVLVQKTIGICTVLVCPMAEKRCLLDIRRSVLYTTGVRGSTYIFGEGLLT